MPYNPMPDKLAEKSRAALEYGKILTLLAGKCACPDAAELARALLPAADAAAARAALQETADACRLTLRFGGPSFFGLRNIEAALERARLGSALTMRELLDVAADLTTIGSLVKYRETTRSLDTCLSPLFDALVPNRYLAEKIGSAILSEEEMADAASGELSDIRRHIRQSEARVREQLDRMIRSPATQKYLQDPVVTIRAGRFVVPVKAEFRSDVPGLVHDTSASGATVFVEPMGAVEANNELRVLRLRELKEMERILAALSTEVGEFADGIRRSVRLAVRLDFIFAKSRLSFEMKAAAPEITDERRIELIDARHPLIDAKKVVPVRIALGAAYDTLVVTGPNTGGKTVALKTLGLLTLMALSGLMIPAGEKSRVGFFSEVLADIGDEQSIEQSLSTFSAHMTNIIEILQASGSGSLVLLDELGSGTDPVEGAALAVSILENLRAHGAKIAATTHYPELKAYALRTERVENACCEFDVATLRPTYRLLIGVPGRSNAFAISERLGLPGEVIARAKEYVSAEDTRFEDVVQNLEASRQKMENERQEAAQMRMEAENLRRQAERLREETAAQQEKELDRARKKASRMLEQTRRQADMLMEEIERLRRAQKTEEPGRLRDAAKAALGSRMRELETAADPVTARRSAAYRLPRPLRAGDTVLLEGVNKTGTVLTPPDASGYAEVQAGIIKTRVKAEELRLLDAPEEKQTYTVRTNIDRAHIAVKPEFDMRGQNVEEGLLDLDRYLDNAVLAGLTQVSIIHGKGTGVLRAAVQQHLKGHPSVKSFRSGRYGEGEMGVTIAELK